MQKKANNYGNERQAWIKLSRQFEPTTGASKTRLHKKFSKLELYDVTRNPKEWITCLELLRGDLQILDVHIGEISVLRT